MRNKENKISCLFFFITWLSLNYTWLILLWITPSICYRPWLQVLEIFIFWVSHDFQPYKELTLKVITQSRNYRWLKFFIWSMYWAIIRLGDTKTVTATNTYSTIMKILYHITIQKYTYFCCYFPYFVLAVAVTERKRLSLILILLSLSLVASCVRLSSTILEPSRSTIVWYICILAYNSLGTSLPRLGVITSDLCVFWSGPPGTRCTRSFCLL